MIFCVKIKVISGTGLESTPEYQNSDPGSTMSSINHSVDQLFDQSVIRYCRGLYVRAMQQRYSYVRSKVPKFGETLDFLGYIE